MDFKKTTEILRQKMEYLVKINSRDTFNILDFHLEFFGQKSLLEEYEIFVSFDYLLLWDSSPRGFGIKLEQIISEMSDLLNQYRITEEYKLVKSDGVHSYDPLINSINYIYEEKHIINMVFFFIAEP